MKKFNFIEIYFNKKLCSDEQLTTAITPKTHTSGTPVDVFFITL